MKSNEIEDILKYFIMRVADRATKLDNDFLGEIERNLNHISQIVEKNKDFREVARFIDAAKMHEITQRDNFRMGILNGLRRIYDKVN